ncbi:MAG TPA: helix-turn-helix transcriptional regulator [Gaiellaceae bacterium]|nr:helix-turn-helix transcriptional regulator [Gaiellaceae bacterium]
MSAAGEALILYARDAGRALRRAREDKGWSQSELARRSRTSSAMISTLEGIIGRRVSVSSADRIAAALGVEIDALFTAAAPAPDAIGRRARPATPPHERYDGTRARAERAAWQRYLEKVQASAKPVYEWPRPLSLTRAAQRFGLNPRTLSAAARAGRVRGRLSAKPGAGRYGEVYEFDEAELGEDLAALPACGYAGCDRRALGPSGGCEEHGHIIVWTGQRHSAAARRRMSEARSGTRRPDAAARLRGVHADARQRFEALLAGRDLLTIDDVAARIKRSRPYVYALLRDGRLKVRHWAKVRHLPGRPLFAAPDVKAVAVRERGEHGREAWRTGGPWAQASIRRPVVSLRAKRRWWGRWGGAKGAIAGFEKGKPGPGRPATASREQVEEVRRLRRQGKSYRQIALAVFGDVRLKNRVHRILSG